MSPTITGEKGDRGEEKGQLKSGVEISLKCVFGGFPVC